MSKPKHERALADHEAQAILSNVRTSPRKLNLVAAMIRNLPAQRAIATLTFSKRRIAHQVRKTLESAIANAENNHQLDVDRLIVRYASPLALLRDLRRMGAGNALSARRRVPLRRATLTRMLEIYADTFGDADGKVRATFEIIWLSGWAPHESQQQPLRPGSARARLADALGTTEISADEKAGR